MSIQILSSPYNGSAHASKVISHTGKEGECNMQMAIKAFKRRLDSVVTLYTQC